MAKNIPSGGLGTQSVMFINKALEVLPQNNITSSIRSHMYHIARELPCNCFEQIIRNKRCGTCGFALQRLTHVFNLEPPKKVSRFLRRLKLKTNLNTKYQILSRKKFDKHKEIQQILALKCNMCNTVVKQNIRKPYLENLRKKQQPTPVTITPSNKKTKAKKKKDPFSGLNKLLVNNAKLALENNNITEVPKKLQTQLQTINLLTPNNSIIDISDSAPSTPRNASIINISDDMLTPVYSSNKISRKRKLTNILEKGTHLNEIESVPQNKLLKTATQVVHTSTHKQIINELETTKSKSLSANMKTRKTVLNSSKKKKKNKNIILVSDKNEKEKKQKKLNILSNLLQKQIGTLKSTTSSLQDFLTSIQ